MEEGEKRFVITGLDEKNLAFFPHEEKWSKQFEAGESISNAIVCVFAVGFFEET